MVFYGWAGDDRGQMALVEGEVIFVLTQLNQDRFRKQASQSQEMRVSLESLPHRDPFLQHVRVFL